MAALSNLSDLASATDEDLLGRVRRKEYPAFVAIFDRYRNSVVSFAARMTGDPDEAEGLSHDIFQRMVNDASRAESGTPFKPFLFRIARDIIGSFVAKNRPEAKASIEKLESVGAPQNPSLDSRQTFAALNKLGPVHREVLYLRTFERLTYEEIAVVTGDKIPTVRNRMNYAVEHLRKELG
jgi:RNA polymerase sigma factor (sigma-70 family)